MSQVLFDFLTCRTSGESTKGTWRTRTYSCEHGKVPSSIVGRSHSRGGGEWNVFRCRQRPHHSNNTDQKQTKAKQNKKRKIRVTIYKSSLKKSKDNHMYSLCVSLYFSLSPTLPTSFSVLLTNKIFHKCSPPQYRSKIRRVNGFTGRDDEFYKFTGVWRHLVISGYHLSPLLDKGNVKEGSGVQNVKGRGNDWGFVRPAYGTPVV